MKTSYTILHDRSRCRFYLEEQGYTAYVGYEVMSDTLNIVTTQVAKPLGGLGIAAELVKATYDYTVAEGLKITATCSFAVVWLERNTR